MCPAQSWPTLAVGQCTLMSFQVTYPPSPAELMPRPLLPTLALLIYERATQHGSEALLRKHAVQQGDVFTLGPAQALTRADVNNLTHLLAGQGLQRTRPTTLAVGLQCVAWWRPPGLRPMLFDAKYAQSRSVARLSGIPVPHPGLVFVATPDTLKVYAVAGNGLPTDDTPLMHAPYWNMFPSGQLCRGTTRYPDSCTPTAQDDWETAFFQSVFTGPSRTDRYMNWGKSYEELLDAALAAGTVPEQVLLPAGLTLAQALS